MTRTLRHQIQQATAILMGGTLLLHGFRFLKSLFIANYYGTSSELDAYFLALAPYSLVCGIIAGALQVTLIPKYLELRVRDGEQQAAAVLLTFAAWLLPASLFIGLCFWQGASLFASVLASGLRPAEMHLSARLLQMSSILLALTLLNEPGVCVFHAQRRFRFCAFIPLVGSLASFAYLLCFHQQGVFAILYGLIFGMSLQTFVVCFAVRRNLPTSLAFVSPLHKEVRSIFKLIAPLLFGASFGHVNILVDQMMASTLSEGSIAALNYAAKLHQFSTQFCIIVVLQAVFPFLAQQAAEGDTAALKTTFYLTTKRMLRLLLPLSLVIFCCGRPLVQLLFQRGAFTADSTSATAGAWLAYTLGLTVQGIRHLMVRMLNALQENTLLMYVAAGSVGLNVLCNLVFMRFWGHIGIALSTSAVHIVTAAALFYFLNKKIGLTSYDRQN